MYSQLVALIGSLTFLPALADAQAFQGLATINDGSILYFSSSIRPQGSDLTFHDKIYRWDATNGFQVAAEVRDEVPPQVCQPGNFFNLLAPQVSADGSILAYTGQRDVFYQSLAVHCAFEESYQGVILRNGQQLTLDGNLSLTSNGLYAITTPGLAAANALHAVTDLTSGTSTIVAGAFNNSPQRVTDEATIITPQPNAVILTDRNGFTSVIETQNPVSDAIINRSGSKILYLTNFGPYNDGSLSIVDIGTGSETYMDCALGCHSPGLTSDGSGVMYALEGSAWDLLALPGTGVTIADRVASATLSGDGRVAYVVTNNSRLLRVDATSGDITELAASTAQITNAYLLNVSPANPVYSAAAGEVLTLVGSGDMQTADFCGHPSSRLAGSGNRFQVPFDTPDGDCQIIVRGASSFENAISLSIVSFDPRFSGILILHQNFSIITQSNPAQPGEDIVAYMTGLGRLDASGNIAAGFGCMFDGVAANVPYAGLTSNFPGIYQVNIEVPNLSPRDANLSCGFPAGADPLGAQYASITVPIGPQ